MTMTEAKAKIDAALAAMQAGRMTLTEYAAAWDQYVDQVCAMPRPPRSIKSR
jgi:hypothetical protein